jgi:hypothetical protein
MARLSNPLIPKPSGPENHLKTAKPLNASINHRNDFAIFKARKTPNSTWHDSSRRPAFSVMFERVRPRMRRGLMASGSLESEAQREQFECKRDARSNKSGGENGNDTF